MSSLRLSQTLVSLHLLECVLFFVEGGASVVVGSVEASEIGAATFTEAIGVVCGRSVGNTECGSDVGVTEVMSLHRCVSDMYTSERDASYQVLICHICPHTTISKNEIVSNLSRAKQAVVRL